MRINKFLKLLGFVKCYFCGQLGHKYKFFKISMAEDNEGYFKCYVCRDCQSKLIGE